jgi:hypothetical protein
MTKSLYGPGTVYGQRSTLTEPGTVAGTGKTVQATAR